MKRIHPHELKPGDVIMEATAKGQWKPKAHVRTITINHDGSCNGVHIEHGKMGGGPGCYDRAMTLMVDNG